MATDITPPPKPSPQPATGTATAEADPTPSITDSAAAIIAAPTTATNCSASPPASITPRPPEPDAEVIHIPSYSRWFSWNAIHECEVRFVPEFFDGRSPSKNPKFYKFYRNTIIRRFRDNPARKITFTEVRKTIVGDVGSIRRVFDFLESWGLINFTGSNLKQPQLKWEDKENKSTTATSQGGEVPVGSSVNADVALPKNRLCSGCKTPCTISCFASDKHDMILCARCYVRGNYLVGMNQSDFKRVEISEESKTDWSDKETLQLLEAVMHYGDDWKKVSEHVGGKNVKDCVARFIKLPFGEQFDGPPESAELDAELGLQNGSTPAKRMSLSPLADASNPIMAQAAFLSTLVGVDVAEVAAHAAVTALSDLIDGKNEDHLKASSNIANQQDSEIASNGTMEGALAEAKLQLEKEEGELENAISGIAVQTKEIEDKILNFEEMDLQIERKWKHLQLMQSSLFVDQLSLLFHQSNDSKIVENTGSEAIKID
ncbi:SWI/SNF complex subunit SWI3B [Primulina eburnea]|uniref:SWI/SNF complex subunit SWI3B n=1 Tax=Primulina eburnea TaxID=1245227 RepID=UPI003C6BFF5D